MLLTNWLNRPYPFIEDTKLKLLLGMCFGIFVVLFLGIFEPFGTYQIIEDKYLHLSGYGFCTFLGVVCNYMVLPKLFPKVFDPEKWQIKKEILFIVLLLVVIAVFNYLFNTYFNPYKIRQIPLYVFMGKTFSIGVFPVMLLTYFIERNLSKKNESTARSLSASISHKQENQDSNTSEIYIQPETQKSEPLTLSLSNFMFATSDNNYTTVFYLKNSETQSKLLRLSLKNLEEQLSSFTNIIRCHRSYLVNKDKIKTIKGNARSLILQLEHCNETIPVSRSFSKEQLV